MTKQVKTSNKIKAVPTFGATISERLKASNPETYRKLVSDFAVSTRNHK